MAKTDDIVLRAQKRGINISQDKDGAWHGSYVYEGQEYTLDNEEPEALVDDFEALAEILAQDDTYELEYNDDLDRYIIAAEGEKDTFSDQVLAKAFAAAKGAVMKRMQAKEDERKAKEEATKPKDEAAPKRTRAKASAANGPAEPEGRFSSTVPADLPPAVAEAVVSFLNAVTSALKGVGGISAGGGSEGTTGFKPAQPSEAFAEPEAPPPPKKRGLGTSKKG